VVFRTTREAGAPNNDRYSVKDGSTSTLHVLLSSCMWILDTSIFKVGTKTIVWLLSRTCQVGKGIPKDREESIRRGYPGTGIVNSDNQDITSMIPKDVEKMQGI
jgi:hypothetical protein